MLIQSSTIFIVNEVEEMLKELIINLPVHDTRVIKNQEEEKFDFLISHARAAIAESYLSSSTTKYIILAGNSFSIEAQNALLKVLEEPPRNIVFLMVTISKNALLPTIYSRLPLVYKKTKKKQIECPLDFVTLDLKDIYQFLKEHQRINKLEAKEMIESILGKIQKQNIKLTQKELNSFSIAMKLCELNSRPINILTTLLLNLITKR
jgi:DNA polymerase-3 subunit delta'